MSRSGRRLLLLLAGLAAGPAGPAAAHPAGITGVKVLLGEGNALVSVVAHAEDLRGGDPAAEIRSRLRLELGGERFSPVDEKTLRDPANKLVTWQARSELTGAELEARLAAPMFPENGAGGTLFTVYRAGRLVDSRLVKPDGGAGGGGLAATIGRYVHQGVLHIFLGPDHVLFLLCLLLLGGSLAHLLRIVTSFTLAHSVTLSLAATGVLTLPSGFVEPVIALSIVVAGIENLRRRRGDFRPYLAFGFGLIHGFGFAGALAELGLPGDALGWALAAFNVGVELGQLAIVLVVSPLLALLHARRPAAGVWVARIGSGAVIAAGLFWFVERVMPA